MNLYFKNITEIILRSYPDASIYVYGSYARGTQTEESDIDICILLPDGTNVHRFNRPLNITLSNAIKKHVSCVFCTRKNAWCELLIHAGN